MSTTEGITTHSTTSRLIEAWSRGDKEAFKVLTAKVYEQLQNIARGQFASEPAGHTLQPTAVVSEICIKLIRCESVHWKNRRHFFSSIAGMMRQILVDHARKRQASKRGSDFLKLSLEEITDIPQVIDAEVVAVDDALKGLAKFDPRPARILEMHFFGGMTYEEIADVEGVSFSTVRREVRNGLLWLRRELSRDGQSPED